MIFRKCFVASLLGILLISFIKSVHSGSGMNVEGASSKKGQRLKEVRRREVQCALVKMRNRHLPETNIPSPLMLSLRPQVEKLFEDQWGARPYYTTKDGDTYQ